MPRVRAYNEGQSATATFQFFDQDFTPSSPSTARYRIDCLSTGRQVRDWTELTPAQLVEVPIAPEDNAILNSRNPIERRQMVVQSNYGTPTQAVQDTEWTVKNLQGVR